MNSKTTLAILAGGESSRMGTPKTHLLINGRPILEYLLDRLEWKGPTLLVTAPGKERPPGCDRFDREVVDAVSGQGPLRGILTALEQSMTSRLIVMPLDMPMLLPAHLRQLAKSFEERTDVLGLMPAPQVGSRGSRRAVPARLSPSRREPRFPESLPDSGIIEPFPSIFHTRAREILQRRLDASQLAVSQLLDEPGFARITVNWEPQTWLNLNHPQDLQLLTQQGLTVTQP